MSRVPVNPFALGAAFVARAVELGWVEVDADGRRNSYYLTDSGNEGLETFGVKLENAMQFAILPERTDSAPRRRASSSMSGHGMQAHRSSHGGPSPRGPMPSHGGPSHGSHRVVHDRPPKVHDRQERRGLPERHGGPRKRG